MGWEHAQDYGDEWGEEEEQEWLSLCCGAPPHEATPDVGSDNTAGICAGCRDWTGFELTEAE